MATATQENQAQTAPDRGIRLTEAAVERVRGFLEREGGLGLRIDVRRTGCSGWAYDVGLAEAIEESDHSFEQDGLTIVVSDKAMPMVAGTTVDFVHEGLVREFRFRNPNVTGECGCGESFTVGQ
ncbi:HesB/IscA family protein [Wenzhouxiangella sediminis]|uniref:Iron-sulfur cluster assembly accessory protein n=1 Tax=Wenzhouxiangella sediminis TaxID=1792836 RepID=A0A3E1K584_9GAMM|nr:iron-sulfur cluster assembly accessory protein [Wenzhouxiangella sediminis]RFF29193.1 iron-sulfur cluster assembly accessory protein [Wenzhouxiangella sediminis]